MELSPIVKVKKMLPTNHIHTGSKIIPQINNKTLESDRDSDKVATQSEIKKADSYSSQDHDNKPITQRSVNFSERNSPFKSNDVYTADSAKSHSTLNVDDKLKKNAEAYEATFHAKIDYSSPKDIDILKKMEVSETEIALVGITKEGNNPIKIVLAMADDRGYFTSQQGKEFQLSQ